MDPQNPNPDVPAPSAEPAAPAPATVQPAAGSEEQQVPFSRFQEVNDSVKAERERAEAAEARIAELESSQQQPQSGDDSIDPDVEKMLDAHAKRRGYLTKEEIESRERQAQIKQDVATLQNRYKDSGTPFDDKEVYKFAREHGMPIGSIDSWDAAYRYMNHDKLVEAERNRAVEAYKAQGASGAERPAGGGSSAKPPEQPKVTGLKARIQAARQHG